MLKNAYLMFIRSVAELQEYEW